LAATHRSIFVANDEVEVAVLVPVKGNGHDHLQVRLHTEAAARGVLRLCAGADVLEVRESVEELAADEIEISVAVEVREAGRRHAERIDRHPGRENLFGLGILGRGFRTDVRQQKRCDDEKQYVESKCEDDRASGAQRLSGLLLRLNLFRHDDLYRSLREVLIRRAFGQSGLELDGFFLDQLFLRLQIFFIDVSREVQGLDSQCH